MITIADTVTIIIIGVLGGIALLICLVITLCTVICCLCVRNSHLKTKIKSAKINSADDKVHHNYFELTDQGSNVTLTQNPSYIVTETNTEGIRGEYTELAMDLNIDARSK